MEDTLFDKIVRGELNARVIWKDDNYLAFLTPFPNTPGVTVVIPKTNIGDYIFSLEDDEYKNLLFATKTVAKILEKAFNTPRVAMVFEGTGVAYVHSKLYPLHGKLAAETGVWGESQEYSSEYLGHLTTVEGPKMNEKELDKIEQMILEAQK